MPTMSAAHRYRQPDTYTDTLAADVDADTHAQMQLQHYAGRV